MGEDGSISDAGAESGPPRRPDYRQRLLHVRSRQVGEELLRARVRGGSAARAESAAELASLRAENVRLRARVEALERGQYQKEKSIGAALYRQNRARQALRQSEKPEKRFVLEIGQSLVDVEQQTSARPELALMAPEYQEFTPQCDNTELGEPGHTGRVEYAQGMFMQKME